MRVWVILLSWLLGAALVLAPALDAPEPTPEQTASFVSAIAVDDAPDDDDALTPMTRAPLAVRSPLVVLPGEPAALERHREPLLRPPRA